jgi:hypothetical protein
MAGIDIENVDPKLCITPFSTGYYKLSKHVLFLILKQQSLCTLSLSLQSPHQELKKTDITIMF